MKINWKAVPEAFKVLGKLGEKHLPTILTGLGVAGFIGTAVLAAKEAPKAETAIRKAEREKSERENPGELALPKVNLTLWEKTKATAGYYWPSVALGTASTVCILSAHKIDLTRLASVTAAYQLSKKDIKELKDKIIEKDGEKKLEEYRSDIREDTLRAHADKGINPVYTGYGDTLFYEPMSQTFFYDDIFRVEKILISAVVQCNCGSGYYGLAEFQAATKIFKNPFWENWFFTSKTFGDLDETTANRLFKYTSIDAVKDNGDGRPCVWLDFDGDRRLEYFPDGAPF